MPPGTDTARGFAPVPQPAASSLRPEACAHAQRQWKLTLGDILSSAENAPHDVVVIKRNYREQPAFPVPEIAYLPTDATQEQVR